MANVVQIVIKALDQTKGALVQPVTQLTAMQKAVKAVTPAIATMAAGAAAGFALMAKSFINTADKANDLSKRLGISTEALSALTLQAKMAGADTSDLETGIKKFSQTIDGAIRNQKASVELFERLGISIRDANGVLKPTEELLREVSDRFAGMEDGARKTALATDLFGRNGQALIPMLNEGSRGMDEMAKKARELGVVISKETAAQADEFNDQLELLRLRMVGVVQQTTAKLLPALVELVKEGGKLIDWLKGSSTSAIYFRDALATLTTSLLAFAVASKTATVSSGALAAVVGAGSIKSLRDFTAAIQLLPAALIRIAPAAAAVTLSLAGLTAGFATAVEASRMFSAQAGANSAMVRTTETMVANAKAAREAIAKLESAGALSGEEAGGFRSRIAGAIANPDQTAAFNTLHNTLADIIPLMGRLGQTSQQAVTANENLGKSQQVWNAELATLQSNMQGWSEWADTQLAEFQMTVDQWHAQSLASLENWNKLEFEAQMAKFDEERLAAEDNSAKLTEIETLRRLKIQELEAQHQTKLNALTNRSLQLRRMYHQQTAEAIQGIFGNLAQAAATFGKKGFAVYKAFAIPEALVATYLAATKALASAPPPINYVLAAAVTAAGLANVAMIASQEPPSYAVGSDYIPSNQMAQLHQGERVVQSDANEDLTEFLDGSSQSVVQLVVDGSVLGEVITDLTRSGRIRIDRRAVV